MRDDFAFEEHNCTMMERSKSKEYILADRLLLALRAKLHVCCRHRRNAWATLLNQLAVTMARRQSSSALHVGDNEKDSSLAH